MKDFDALDEKYLEFFPEDKQRLARTCVQVAGWRLKFQYTATTFIATQTRL
jgi:hypothetical protein